MACVHVVLSFRAAIVEGKTGVEGSVKAQEAPLFLLVHGAWHGAWCFGPLQLALARLGGLSCPLELPGHGIDARIPSSAEIAEGAVSRAAGIDWHEAVASLAEAIADIRSFHRGPTIIVGHSAGGAMVSALGERCPDLLDRLVYLCAFLLPPGLSTVAASMLPENGGALAPTLLKGPPDVLKALRIDPRSSNAEYRDLIKQTFYSDMTDSQATAAMWQIVPDEPLPPDVITTTAHRWGSVPRTFIVAERDRAIRPALQRRFITETDAAFPERQTDVLSIDSDHSPFFTATESLAKMLAGIGRNTPRRDSEIAPT